MGIGSLLGSGYTSTFPPITGSLEFGFADDIIRKGTIGVAPFIGFGTYKYAHYTGHENYTYIPVGVRGVFHYPFVEKLDTYAGLLFGYIAVSGTHIGMYTQAEVTDQCLSVEDIISLKICSNA